MRTLLITVIICTAAIVYSNKRQLKRKNLLKEYISRGMFNCSEEHMEELRSLLELMEVSQLFFFSV